MKINSQDKWSGLLVPPLLISVQGFAFRGRPMSLLVACAPAGPHLFCFSRRSLRLALQFQSTARSNCIHETYIHHDNKKTRTINQFSIDSSCLNLTKILLSQPLLYNKVRFCFYHSVYNNRKGMHTSIMFSGT